MSTDPDAPEIGDNFESESSEPHSIARVEETTEHLIAKNATTGVQTSNIRYFVWDTRGSRWAIIWDGERFVGHKRPPRI